MFNDIHSNCKQMIYNENENERLLKWAINKYSIQIFSQSKYRVACRGILPFRRNNPKNRL